MTPRFAVTLLSSVLLFVGPGCPDAPDPADPGGDPTPGPSASASPGAGAGAGVGAGAGEGDPLAGMLFTAEQVREIFAAERAGEQAVLEQHGLVDGAGSPNRPRQEAYERALQALAAHDPAAWSEFLDGLPQ